ncbi:MAG: hypothetical protein AAB434_02660 [Planctomycetota bacterium]
MTSAETLRFHIDRRGRILVENATRASLEIARALAPEDPAVRDLLARADEADWQSQLAGRRKHGERRA